MAADRMLRDTDQDLRITWFRALGALAETPQGLRGGIRPAGRML